MFYGVILGVFLIAFYFKRINGSATFWSAIIVELYIVISAIWPWMHSKFPGLMNNMPGGFDTFMYAASKIGFLRRPA